jgi:putative serine protease PepD
MVAGDSFLMTESQGNYEESHDESHSYSAPVNPEWPPPPPYQPAVAAPEADDKRGR